MTTRNSLPLIPDLEVLPWPLRYLALGLLVLGPLLLLALVLVGAGSSPTVTVEATVVDAPPSDAEVHALSEFPADSPVRAAVEEALREGTGSAQGTKAEVRNGAASGTEYYVERDGRVVKVTLGA
jgi:hypothetical protein